MPGADVSPSEVQADHPVSQAPVGVPAISVHDLDITYRTSIEARPTLKGAIIRLGRPHRSIRVVEAVKDVSFDVTKGSVLGIIGANGAGKSTLMRAVAGILPPTKGRIEIHGRVSTLLALGVGFNGALTGRQNVVLGSLAAGLSRSQIDQKYDEIAAFAELGDFMDMPMQSGCTRACSSSGVTRTTSSRRTPSSSRSARTRSPSRTCDPPGCPSLTSASSRAVTTSLTHGCTVRCGRCWRRG